MTSSKRNKTLHIDTEALSTLALVQEGLQSPVTGLMSKKEAKEVDKTKFYKGIPFPFAFTLAPNGKKNHQVLSSVKKGEKIDLISNRKKVGELVVSETFAVDPLKRLKSIYGTSDLSHPGVRGTMARLGNISVCGEYKVQYPIIADNKRRINSLIEKTDAKLISSMVLSANPLNRVHERMIRQAIDQSDLLVIFLRKPFTTDGLRYDIRYNALLNFTEIFIARNRVLIIPFENTYIFSGYNELILDALLVKNYGCNQLIIGENYGGLGLYHGQNRIKSLFKECESIDIDIKIFEEHVYCNICKTLVNSQTCPHGQHHHIHYHSGSIMKLIEAGLVPPALLVRKEVSASILAALFPNRFDNLQNLYYSLMPGTGLLEQQSEEQFYINLIELHGTSSLT